MRAEAQKLHVSVASLTASPFSSLSHAHSYRHDIYRNTRYIYQFREMMKTRYTGASDPLRRSSVCCLKVIINICICLSGQMFLGLRQLVNFRHKLGIYLQTRHRTGPQQHSSMLLTSRNSSKMLIVLEKPPYQNHILAPVPLFLYTVSIIHIIFPIPCRSIYPLKLKQVLHITVEKNVAL